MKSLKLFLFKVQAKTIFIKGVIGYILCWIHCYLPVWTHSLSSFMKIKVQDYHHISNLRDWIWFIVKVTYSVVNNMTQRTVCVAARNVQIFAAFCENLGNTSHVSCRAAFTYISWNQPNLRYIIRCIELIVFSLQQQLKWFHKTFTDISTVLSWYVNV